MNKFNLEIGLGKRKFIIDDDGRVKHLKKLFELGNNGKEMEDRLNSRLSEMASQQRRDIEKHFSTATFPENSDNRLAGVERVMKDSSGRPLVLFRGLREISQPNSSGGYLKGCEKLIIGPDGRMYFAGMVSNDVSPSIDVHRNIFNEGSHIGTTEDMKMFLGETDFDEKKDTWEKSIKGSPVVGQEYKYYVTRVNVGDPLHTKLLGDYTRDALIEAVYEAYQTEES